jgi:hypothetical protein
MWAGLIKRADHLRKNKNKEKPLHNRDVSVMFGWAVFHARRTKMIEKYRRNDDLDKHEELIKDIIFFQQ